MIRDIPTVDDLNALADQNFIKENDITKLGKMSLEYPQILKNPPKQISKIDMDPALAQSLSSIKDPKLSKDVCDVLNEIEFDVQANNTQGAYEKILKILNRLEEFR